MRRTRPRRCPRRRVACVPCRRGRGSRRRRARARGRRARRRRRDRAPDGDAAREPEADPGTRRRASRPAVSLEGIRGIRYVEPLVTRRLAFTPTDPLVSKQWYLGYSGFYESWVTLPSFEPIPVAVIDSGVDASHPELAREDPRREELRRRLGQDGRARARHVRRGPHRRRASTTASASRASRRRRSCSSRRSSRSRGRSRSRRRRRRSAGPSTTARGSST